MRCDYDEGCDGWDLIRWRGAVNSAIKGKRGQTFLREMLQSLDALPEKELIAQDLVNGHGQVCAIGSVGKARGIDMTRLDPYGWDHLAEVFGISSALVREVEYINDGWSRFDECHASEKRFNTVREWVLENLTYTVT